MGVLGSTGPGVLALGFQKRFIVEGRGSLFMG